MKVRRLIPALCMLLVSAILLGTSTYAWFSMNTTVTANNMQVKAVADQGILINEVATANDPNWDNAANTTAGSGYSLHPTSTSNTSTWYVAYSKTQNDSASATESANSVNLTDDGYRTLGASPFTTATATVTPAAGSIAGQTVTYVDSDAGSDYDNGEGYYVKYTYYLKSSADAITTSLADGGKSLRISVSATGDTNTPALDKALRAAVVIDSKAYFFAPLKDDDTTVYVGTAHTASTAYVTAQPTAVVTIPASGSNGIQADVYLYFEGEDSQLKTSNVVAALDDLTVTVNFELATNSGAVTAHPVAVA